MIGKLFLWHDFLKNRELGELLGNPKGTKSFSSWSEFTDFVNEMPIKTIQPFVSNFNAFAGEGFYGNVVQGLVIKQLEDAVFIFGIAIDGTLIFRKRNYPDVSTWEDPKIIIHSNNWHKIYFVTDLGELIPLATNKSNGLMGAIDKCSIPFPLLSGGSYYVHVPMEGLPFLLQISAPSVAPGLFCCCKTSSSFTINRLFKSADIEGGLVFTYKESMLYVKRSGVYFNIIPLHSGYIFKQGTGDIPNDAIELTIQWIVDNMLLGELLPLSTNTNKGLTRRTAYFDLIQGKLYKIAYKEELHVYKPVICLLYVLRNGISSCYVASLSGYRNGVSHFKLICGNDIQFKLYQKLNSTNYFDIMLECPDNSAGIMEIKAMDDLTVIETTEPLRDWQQIATE